MRVLNFVLLLFFTYICCVLPWREDVLIKTAFVFFAILLGEALSYVNMIMLINKNRRADEITLKAKELIWYAVVNSCFSILFVCSIFIGATIICIGTDLQIGILVGVVLPLYFLLNSFFTKHLWFV